MWFCHEISEIGVDSRMIKVANVFLRREGSCRFLVEVVGRINAGPPGIQNGCDLAMRCGYLCDQVQLIRLGEQRIPRTFDQEHHRRQRRMVVDLFDDGDFSRIQLHD